MTRTFRVAIVDDHALFVDALGNHLRSIGYDVVWTGTDPSLVPAHQEPLDLILLDLNLDDNWVTTHQVQVLARTGAKVVIVTGFPDYQKLSDLILAGAVTIIDKHEPVARLTETIEQVLREGVDLSPLVAATLAATFRPTAIELSPQEARVLALYGSGMPIRTVAETLHLSTHTVKEYLRRVRRKLAELNQPASTQVDLYRAARHLGVLDE